MGDDRDLRSLILATSTGKQLSEYQLNLLENQGIRNAEEFVNADKLHTVLALSSYKTEELKRELLDLVANRISLKSVWQAKPTNYSTGIEELDKLLDAIDQPLCPGRVWEIIGESDMGKTQLMHTLAANFVYTQGANQQVLFVDTTLDFDSRRLVEILQHRQLSTEAINQHLDAIKVIKGATAEELLKALKDLHDKLSGAKRQASGETIPRIKLILIDSLTVCFILFRTNYDRNKGRSYLNELATTMRKLAVLHGVAFVISNTTVVDDDDNDCNGNDEEEGTQWLSAATQEESTCLGQYWCSVCTLTLALHLPEESSGEDGLRLLKVLNNSCGMNKASCWLRITDAGVV